MKNNYIINSLERLIKNLKILYQNLRGNTLPKIDKIKFQNNLSSSSKKKKILIAVSTGGLSSMLVFESLLGKLLQNKNCEVDYLLCDEILPACVMATIHRIDEKDFSKHGSQKICSYCFIRSSEYLRKAGGNIIKFSDFINNDELNEINKITFNDDLLKNIKKFKFDGINIGEHASSGTVRFFSATNLQKFKNSKEILIKYIKASLITQKVCNNLFTNKKYDELFINHGIYVPQGVILDCAKKFNINTSAWCFAYARNSVNITRDDTYHRALINEKKDKWNDFNFDSKLESTIDNFLKQRSEGGSVPISDDWDVKIKNQNLNTEDYFIKRKIDTQKPIIGLATNMLWDAQVYYPTNFFSSTLEWIFFTIDYFSNRPDLQLIIRVHPAEVLTTTKSYENVENLLLEKYKELPKNIFLIKPEEKISTYSVFKKCNTVLVWNSKIAMETMSANIPTIVCGESFLRNKSISFDPNSKLEYVSMLDKLPFLKNPITKERLTLAKKYAFHFFFRRTVKINSLYERKNKTPNIGIRDNVSELLNNNEDPGLKMIIESIINGEDYIFKAEDHYDARQIKLDPDREYL
tara:strand:+ start:9534 stop:11270 length:1737 start_codon:yes stop_codon:yes gene_type:complete